MGLVYVFLMAWVLGGVLLGCTMLLEHGEHDEGGVPGDSEGPARPVGSTRITQLGTMALIGFGLCGLGAEGMGALSAPDTTLCAFAGGTVLALLGYAMSAHRRQREHA